MTVHDSWTVDRLVEAYTHHQRRTRGLRTQTLRNRAWLVRMLVPVALGTDPRLHSAGASRIPHLSHSASRPPTDSSTSWKPSEAP